MAKKYLTRAQIASIFDAAENQMDYVISLHKAALQLFDIAWGSVKSLEGYIKLASPGDLLIMGMAITFDKTHHPEVLPGGAWLNYGFSTGEELKAYTDKWEITLPKITMAQPGQQHRALYRHPGIGP